MSRKDEDSAIQQDKKKPLFCMEKGNFLHEVSHNNLLLIVVIYIAEIISSCKSKP